MFKKSLFITILVLLIATTSFAKNLELNEKHAGKTFYLNNNTAAILELETNPSTGYEWHATSSDSSVVKVVHSKFTSCYPNRLGGSGVRTFHIKNIKHGKADMNFVLKRTYRKNVPSGTPMKKVTFHFISKEPFQGTFPKLESKGGNGKPDHGGGNKPSAFPATFDWRDTGLVSSVKDQGNCGSCWAFATVGVLESAVLINIGVEYDLSEQYLVSCNAEGWSCNGGWFAHDYHWNISLPGLEPGSRLESAYPYTASDSQCSASIFGGLTIRNWSYVDTSRQVPSTEKIKEAIYYHGPVAAAVCVNNAFSSYQDGVFSSKGCRNINHAIMLVGWDDYDECWILKNSWTADWGEDGYMRIKYKSNVVGSYATWIDY